MARKPYSEDQSIHSMTTRQLRQYIADQADEAAKRISSAPGDVSKAFTKAESSIIYKNGKVIRSTSNLRKDEMRELAYAYRQFNSIDYESGFAKSREWKENRSRYEKFIRNRSKDPYWSQYITAKGNISKKGYDDYKNFISTIRSLDDFKAQFGYESIKRYMEQNNIVSDKRKQDLMEQAISKVWEQAQRPDTNWDQNDLMKHFSAEFKKLVANEESKNSIKVKRTGKMREHGKIHR